MARRSTWGSKRERYPGCWELRWRVAGEPGSEYFHGTEREADARLAQLRIRYEGAEPGADMTVSQYFDNVFLEYIERDLAPTTVPGYVNSFDRYVRPEFGDDDLRDVRPKRIQKWLSTLTRSNAKHARAVFSSLMSYAVIDELIEVNPLRNRFRMPKTEGPVKVDEGVYTLDELEEIAGMCAGEVWEAPFYFAAFGGASRYEAMGVRPGDIEESDGWAIVHLRNGVHRIGRAVVVREELKNEFRARDIVIEPRYAVRVLELRDEAVARGDAWMCDDGFGMPCDPDTVSMGYKRWFQSKPLIYHPFKNLRNSYTTVMLSRGIDGSMIAKMIGNSQRGTTERHYERPKAPDFIAAVKRTGGCCG